MSEQLRIFAYGTLKPSECNYQLYCQGKVINYQKVYTFGQLYALNLGYPALTIGEDKVYGYLLIFADDTVLNDLDQLEDYHPQNPPDENEYQRCLIPIFNLKDQPLDFAWGYRMKMAKIKSYTGTLIPSGYWQSQGQSRDSDHPAFERNTDDT